MKKHEQYKYLDELGVSEYDADKWLFLFDLDYVGFKRPPKMEHYKFDQFARKFLNSKTDDKLKRIDMRVAEVLSTMYKHINLDELTSVGGIYWALRMINDLNEIVIKAAESNE